MPEKITITSDVVISLRIRDQGGRVWTVGGVLGDLAISEGEESIPILFLNDPECVIESVQLGSVEYE